MSDRGRTIIRVTCTHRLPMSSIHAQCYPLTPEGAALPVVSHTLGSPCEPSEIGQLISEADLQEPRTPSALREYVVSLRESVRSDPAEFTRALLKAGLYKEFFDELVPLSCFAVLAYPEDYIVQLQLGNQPYDATVLNAAEKEVDRVELAVPQDGRAEANDRELVVARRFGRIAVGEPGDDLTALFPFVLDTCRAKAQKDYGDCTLVIAIAPMPPFEGLEPAYDRLVHDPANEMRAIDFRANRVRLLVMPDRLVEIHG
jgi:hypothetical protein